MALGAILIWLGLSQYPPLTLGQSVFASGSFSSIVTPGGAAGGPTPGAGYSANLYAYFKMEDTSGDAVDSAHARNLGLSTGTEVSVSGKILNALQFGIAPAPILDSRISAGGSGDFWGFDGNSFTIRFWIKTSDSGFNDFLLGTGSDPWFIYLGTPSGHDSKVDFQFDNDTDTDNLMSNEAIGDGNWHRVVCWFDSGTFEIGIQIDNNTPVTDISDAAFSPGSQRMNIGSNLGYAVDIDELAFWSSYTLTSDDRLYDWNSGAGRTYPLP